jgi:hypothetical protein
MQEKENQILIYQTEDDQTKIEVNIDDETVWLTQSQMAELFQKSKSTISEHIKNIFNEGELLKDAVVRNSRTTANDGKTYNTKFYNLDVIISVGYRVKSHRGTQFRIWATERLREYIIKGFTMNDDLLKRSGGGNYFSELLERIRDIRSSEKVFYRQILDIFATSIDYNLNTEICKEFFKTVQNKLHFAAHGNTAAEVIYKRADYEEMFMGLTTFKGENPKKIDILTAKNYLKEDEIKILNRIVSTYLEFAELQAIRQKPMFMKDWVERLDEYLKFTGSELLKNAGSISHKEAKIKAELEYKKYMEKTKTELSKVEKDFLESLKNTQKKLEGKR